MTNRYATAIHCLMALLLLVCGSPLYAAGKKKKKKYLELVSAVYTTSEPGRMGGPQEARYFFTVVWKHEVHPDSFAWRADSGWAMCRVEKTYARRDMPASKTLQMQVQRLGSMAEVKTGDTLLLTASAGKFAVPAGIGSKTKNTLFFKTGGSGWQPCPVNVITKKKGLAAPMQGKLK